MEKGFITAIKNRRSFYSLSKESTIPDEKIEEILRTSLLYAPSAMNSQSTRIVLLLDKNHDKFWDMLLDIMRGMLSKERFPSTEAKLNGFKNSYGTILFFEDQNVVKSLQERYPLYADNFPKWSQQAAAINEFIIWTALEDEGMGASLQHYNELIQSAVIKEWHLPESWLLNAQMPFGKPVEGPGEKTSEPIDLRLKIFK